MAGDTLTRPLFQNRVHAKTGGLKGLYNLLFGIGKQGEMFKYGPDVPVTSIDDLGQTKTINTQTVDPKKRFDVETNIYGQPIDDTFYNIGPKLKTEKSKISPLIETTPPRTETDLFGNTTTVGGSTKVNWGNLYNAPFTNFGTIKQRWSNMPKDQRKKVVRNVLATGTAWTMLPDWMKSTPAAQEVKAEKDKQEITPT